MDTAGSTGDTGATGMSFILKMLPHYAAVIPPHLQQRHIDISAQVCSTVGITLQLTASCTLQALLEPQGSPETLARQVFLFEDMFAHPAYVISPLLQQAHIGMFASVCRTVGITLQLTAS